MTPIRGFRSLGGPYNLPDDVSPNHPHFNPPEPEACSECGDDVWPGENCENCGEYQMTVEEHREAAADDAADRAYDMAREDDFR
jgi:hypothetical protein